MPRSFDLASNVNFGLNQSFDKIFNLESLKGAVSVFQVTLHAKMGIADSQQYPYKVCLIIDIHDFNVYNN